MSYKICLVVDDEPSIRTYLKALLQDEDFQTLEAETAPQAFRVVEKLNGGIDLIVTDINMPGDMDGLDLAYAIRIAFPAVPILLISGYPAPESANRPIGEFEFIEKPFKLETILKAVKKLAGSSKQRAASS